MFSCKFVIRNALLSEINDFIEEQEISNISIFENPNLGFSDDLDDLGFPIAKFFDVEIFVPSVDESIKLLDALMSKFIEDIIDYKSEIVNNQDWVDLYTKELTPVLCDRFYFYNELIQEASDNNQLIPVKLNSALAFGRGHHQTTQGCLLNLVFLENSGFLPKRILDMGCGTGILGICALKLWKEANLLGVDIDNEAVEITKSNYTANNVNSSAIQASKVDDLISKQKLDLILCNILKQPLVDLCPDFLKIINDGGYIITSGFITSQENEVIECYSKNGFEMENRICIEDWLAILFKKKK